MTFNFKKFSLSQLATWFSALVAISATIADLGQYLPSKIAVPVLTITTLIAALNERLHGGVTKLKAELANNEITKKEVVEDYRDEFPSKD